MSRRPLAPQLEGNDAATRSAADPAVLDALLREYWRPLVAYAQRLLGDQPSAEEVVQRAFVRLWEREHQLPAGDAVRPFLYHMVRNLVANEWRRSATHTRWLESAMDDEMPPTPISALEALEAAELERAIEVAVESLPPRRREVFTLSRYHHLSNAQIADVLGVSTQTVANQLVSALRTLRELLRDRQGDAHSPQLRIVRDGRE